MISEEQALAHIIQSVKPLPPRGVPLGEALRRFAAEDIHARIALPVFDNSAMDGYAVVASSCRVGQSQQVVGEQPAGVDRKLRIRPGEAVRVFTGAPIPAGADAVVMQEDVRTEGAQIFITTKVEVHEFIRRRGCDLSEGQKILSAGERIQPPTLALLASQGLAQIQIGGDVCGAIVTTGDELVPTGGSLGAGQIYESNSILVQALFEKCGVTVASVKHSLDERGAIETVFRKGLEQDVLVIVGGVSVGARDLVKPALAAVGVETHLWRVSVKPGKPFLFGRTEHCAIFGLPGNPVSAFMTFLLIVRPAVLRMMGAANDQLSLQKIEARLTQKLQNESDRPHYIRGRLALGGFSPMGLQESHALYGLSQANALLRVPPGQVFPEGSIVQVLILD